MTGDEFPVPEGLGGPDVDMRLRDMRAENYDTPMDMVRAIVRNVESELDTGGWDQPDCIATVNTGASAGGEPHTAYVWVAEMRVPDRLRGDLSRVMPSLAVALTMPVPGLREGILGAALGSQPPGCFPIGVLVAFEAWGIALDGPVTDELREQVERGELRSHPDSKEERHVLLCLNDGTLLHLVHVRGEEPHFRDDAEQQPMTGLLRIVTEAVCQHPMPSPN